MNIAMAPTSNRLTPRSRQDAPMIKKTIPGADDPPNRLAERNSSRVLPMGLGHFLSLIDQRTGRIRGPGSVIYFLALGIPFLLAEITWTDSPSLVEGSPVEGLMERGSSPSPS